MFSLSLSLDSRAQQEIQQRESRRVFKKNIVLGNSSVLRIGVFHRPLRTAPGTAVVHSDVHKLRHGALTRPHGRSTFELHEKLTDSRKKHAAPNLPS
ncbi:putative cysteine ligase BshC [Clarias magur]|uniref:Putative cysteine ligase BshC n=1 Tax=Clarias magur TaxID=1594786 RepID=A0A8J4WX90_CLAMG|nr:putative cysteine ligase BshC [Clarias magur]